MQKLSRMAAVGAGVTAFFGSCCALPLLLLGMTGSIGFAGTLVPYQNYFTIGTILLLAVAFYLVYGRKQMVCEDSKLCSPKSQRITKILLWVSAVLAAIFLIGPYLLAS
jgi:hypothetical protein